MSSQDPESMSWSGTANNKFIHTVIEVEKEEKTLDLTTILSDKHYVALYNLYKQSSLGSFKKAAMELLKEDPSFEPTMEKAGLVPDYFVYCVEYLFSAKRWVPKGAK